MTLGAALSPGDVPGWATFGLLAAGQIVTWVLLARSGTHDAAARAAQSAEAAAKSAAAVEALTKEVGRVATGLEEQTSELRKHVLEDADLHARADEFMKRQVETQETMSRMLENQQRQITNVALRLAPADPVTLPLNTPRRR